MQNKMFLQKIKFNIVLLEIKKLNENLYKNEILLISKVDYKKIYVTLGNYRKIIYDDILYKYGSGYIIGQTTRKEGLYDKSWKRLSIKKSVPFWKVLVSFNKIELIPKWSKIELIKD